MNSWPDANELVHGGRNTSVVQRATSLIGSRHPSRLAPGGASPVQDRLQRHAGRDHRLDWHERRVDGTLILKLELSLETDSWLVSLLIPLCSLHFLESLLRSSTAVLLVQRLPIFAQLVHHATDLYPTPIVQASTLYQQGKRIKQFSEYIHLQLFRRAIADADWPALTIAIQVVVGDLWHV
jgi:hypothetical protein